MPDLDSDGQDRRGQSNGSRKSRFSSENQPRRRRQREPRKNLKASMLAQLRKPIRISVGGEPKTVEYIDGFVQSLWQDLLKAKVGDKLKFLEKLDKLGLTAHLADQAKLDADRDELDTDLREFEQMQRDWRLINDGQRFIADEQKLLWYAAARIVNALGQTCNCGAITDSLAEQIETVCLAFERDQELDRSSDEMILHLRASMMETFEDDDETEESRP